LDEIFVQWVKEHREFLDTLKEEGFLKPKQIEVIDVALREIEG